MTIEKENSIIQQQERYDREAVEYSQHHGDEFSQAYRRRFYRDRLFDFDMKGLRVLDAMGGPGVETEYLIHKGANVIGLDISSNNARLYNAIWDRKCVVSSIHKTDFPDGCFDLVYICGGLHHVLPLLDEVMKEVHRLIAPGGHFIFVEPNADDYMNVLRNQWYKKDKRFDDNEEAISYRKMLIPYLDLGFREEMFFTAGNIAYLTISQSMVLGIPKGIKRLLYRPLCLLELALNYLPFMPKLFFGARWIKIDNRN